MAWVRPEADPPVFGCRLRRRWVGFEREGSRHCLRIDKDEAN